MSHWRIIERVWVPKRLPCVTMSLCYLKMMWQPCRTLHPASVLVNVYKSVMHLSMLPRVTHGTSYQLFTAHTADLHCCDNGWQLRKINVLDDVIYMLDMA